MCTPRASSTSSQAGTCGTKVCCDGRNASPRDTVLNQSGASGGAGRHICRSCRVDHAHRQVTRWWNKRMGSRGGWRGLIMRERACVYSMPVEAEGASTEKHISSHNRDAASPRCSLHPPITSHRFLLPHFDFPSLPRCPNGSQGAARLPGRIAWYGAIAPTEAD